MYNVIGVPWIDEADYPEMREICRGLPESYRTFERRTLSLIRHSGKQCDFVVLIPMTSQVGCNTYAKLYAKAEIVATTIGVDVQ